jgi:signal transduction histidine kinase
VIEKSGDRMLNIIDDIVSVSKIESDNNLSYKETSIKEQIESIYTTLKEEAEQKNIVGQIHNALQKLIT